MFSSPAAIISCFIPEATIQLILRTFQISTFILRLRPFRSGPICWVIIVWYRRSWCCCLVGLGWARLDTAGREDSVGLMEISWAILQSGSAPLCFSLSDWLTDGLGGPQTAISYQHHHQHHQHYAIQSHNLIIYKTIKTPRAQLTTVTPAVTE